ncbi:MAG: hypothetical protein LBC77_01240 [Spirochaetaceae bacterium]|jgi:hypothetical protein|nr:hypothetical protein [Spirochaetaceae bacterium]
MSELETAKIHEIIGTPDMAEILRDQVAAVLSLELQNQYAMAQEAALPDAREFNIPVFVENGRPYESSGGKPLMRFVNVLLPKITVPASNPRMGAQKEQAVFFIDCAACGNDCGTFRDDKSAAIRAWKLTRIVRRILMSGEYAYLGLRGIVGSRIITSMEAGTPEKPELDRESALSYMLVRITLEAQFLEKFIGTEGPPLELISFEVEPSSGEILANGI